MPQEKEIWILQSECDAVEIDSLNKIPENRGFVLHPFKSDSSCKALFIKADSHIKVSLEDFYKTTLTNTQIWSFAPSTIKNYSKTKEEYCKIVANAVKFIQSEKLQKVVLSRMKRIENTLTRNPLNIFYKLCVKYPAAFVSMVYIPDNLTWITATPELLISEKGNEIKTVSLAATKPAGSLEVWGEKEKTEQQIVTDYINEKLKKYCRNVSVSGPEEIIAGNVKHLKTSFSATLNAGLWNLVAALYPTPAVCGIPLNEARQFIEQAEGYDREYYTGFLGPCNINGRTDLFVNLRCAKLFANVANLYIGGGITKDSIPEREWKETELKAKTVLFAFEENEE